MVVFAAITMATYNLVIQCELGEQNTWPKMAEDYKRLYPPEMVEIVMACLSPEPDDRPT
jgi:hypothetical protein